MSTPLPPPQIPGLRYLEKLGAGGYADVYLYEQDMPARKVAVKVLREAGVSASVAGRFTAEANAMAQLEHPHIVPVYAADVTPDGRPYIVMMYFPKANLAERVRRGRLSVAEVLRIGIQIGSAVETAHRARLLHRDIKPANILTNQYGTPGLTDFGIAAQVAAHDDEDTGVSVPWSPPEVLYATQPASIRSDVYSLAATLWHLLVGRSPFEIVDGDNSTFALMRRIRDTPAPSTGRADVPMSLDRLLRTAMAREPQARPATALDLVRSLQSIEQEMRLPRTSLALAEESGETTGLSRLVRADATRVQAPQVVRAQPSLPPVGAPHPAAGPAAPPPAAGPAVPPPANALMDPVISDSSDRTMRRDSSAVVPPQGAALSGLHEPTRLRGRPVEPEPDTEADAGRKPRWAVVALAAVVVGLVVGIGAFLSSGRGSAIPEEPETAASELPPEVGAELLPPGPLAITGHSSGSQVIFEWAYADALDSDSYKWRAYRPGSEPSGSERPAEEPTVTVRALAGGTCIEVRVVRANGMFGDSPSKGFCLS